jgi:hypothetical protein
MALKNLGAKLPRRNFENHSEQANNFEKHSSPSPTHLDRMSVPLATGAPISSNEVKIDPKYEEEHAADFVRLPISHKFYLSNSN